MTLEATDLAQLTTAVEASRDVMRDVVRRLKATMYHYDVEEWDSDRWLAALGALDTEIHIYQTTMEAWIIAADERPEPPAAIRIKG
jgi:hypothetical protein